MKKAPGAQDLILCAWEVEDYLRREHAVHEEGGVVLGRKTVEEICAACGFSEGWWEDVKYTMLDLAISFVGNSQGYYLGEPGELAIYIRSILRQIATRQKSAERTLVAAESADTLRAAREYSRKKLGDPLSDAFGQLIQWDDDDRIKRLLSDGKDNP
jgi:hypothetical protein